VEKKTELAIAKNHRLDACSWCIKIVIACNSASAVYSDTDEVRGIVPFGVSSVFKNNGPQKALIAGNSTVRSGISRKLFAQHGLQTRQRITQPLSIQI